MTPTSEKNWLTNPWGLYTCFFSLPHLFNNNLFVVATIFADYNFSDEVFIVRIIRFKLLIQLLKLN